MFSRHNIEIGDLLAWVAGPIDLAIMRQHGELKIGRKELRALTSKEISPRTDLSKQELTASFSTTRFSVPTIESLAIDIQPRLAPTPLIITLREPIILKPKSITQVFVSTPVWIGFKTNESASFFHELPSLLLKQTWFGPSPREGELCLSCTNRGTIHKDSIEHHPLRALTRVDVHQSDGNSFKLERLKLPMTALNLYRDAEQRLHTDGLRVKIQNQKVHLDFAKELVLSTSTSAELVTRARSKAFTGLERALNAMLG